MRYLYVEWIHTFPDEPVHLHSELDEGNWEIRRVNIFSDGRLEYADCSHETECTGLEMTPSPPIEEINADPQYRAKEITAEEFEALWNKAVAASQG